MQFSAFRVNDRPIHHTDLGKNQEAAKPKPPAPSSPPSCEAEGAGVAFKNIPRGVQHARDEPAGTELIPGTGDKLLPRRKLVVFQRRWQSVRCRCAKYERRQVDRVAGAWADRQVSSNGEGALTECVSRPGASSMQHTRGRGSAMRLVRGELQQVVALSTNRRLCLLVELSKNPRRWS